MRGEIGVVRRGEELEEGFVLNASNRVWFPTEIERHIFPGEE